MNNFEQSASKQFMMAKFQPDNILLVDRYTKQAYNFFELKHQQQISEQLNHDSLLRPLVYGKGLLYPKGDSTLKVQLQNRKRAFDTEHFTEDELCNTFIPLFSCVQYLHSNKKVHGQIRPENIIIIDGQIKVRDWLVQSEQNPYYGNVKNKSKVPEDDFIALGQILMQCATLRKSNDTFQDHNVDIAIQSIVDTYSKSFIFAMLVLLKRKTNLFKQVIPLLQNQSEELLINGQLNSLYTTAKLEKSKKSIKSQPVEKNINIVTPNIATAKKSENISMILQSSPTKRFNITHGGAGKKSVTSRLDDTENKKFFNQEVKKRQIQKITKIIQRSNAFVNELMARKNNSQHNSGQVLKKITGKNTINLNHLGITNSNLTMTNSNLANMSMYAVQPTKKVKQTVTGPVAFSPSKRLRTISRKK